MTFTFKNYTTPLLASLFLAASLSAVSAETSNARSERPATIPCLQPTGGFTFLVGDIPVTALSDGSMPMDLSKVFPASIKEQLGSKNILVDTGSGELLDLTKAVSF